MQVDVDFRSYRHCVGCVRAPRTCHRFLGTRNLEEIWVCLVFFSCFFLGKITKKAFGFVAQGNHNILNTDRASRTRWAKKMKKLGGRQRNR